jgi:hypothetical protein
LKQFICLLLVLGGVSFAQQSSENAVQLRGFVRESVSGSAMANGRVLLSPQQGVLLRVATTNDTGQFEFKDVPPGRYRLFAEREGFLRTEYGQSLPSPVGIPITLVSGRDVVDLRIAIIPASGLRGRVADENREPLRKARVRAMKPRYQEDSLSL